MKKVLLLAALMGATLLGLSSTAAAACVQPYCPAPTAVTGTATATTTSATLTGTVNSNGGGNASWAIVLNGPGGSTVVATGVAPDNAGPVAVSGVASNLTPGTGYSFQVTASGPGGQASGAIVGFTTQTTAPSGGGGGTGGGGTPSTSEKVTPDVSIRARPKSRDAAPYRYTISGRLTGVTNDSQCTGRVTVKFSRGSVIKRATTSVDSDCTYDVTATVPSKKLPSNGSNINVRATFQGNDSLNKASSDTVKVGYTKD
jgi:hypothetical protein